MADFALSRAAADDLLEIDDFTRKEFGLEQAARLRQRFRKTLDLLAAVPGSSPHRPDYDPPGKQFRYCAAIPRFVIVYETGEDGIQVVRVLHGARDLERELRREASDD